MIKQELLESLQRGEKHGFENLVQLAVQEALRMLPIINENIIRQSAVIHKASSEFYEKNPELVPHKKMVAEVIERIESEEPGLGFDQILRRAAPEAKKLTQLGAPIQTKKRLAELDDVVGML